MDDLLTTERSDANVAGHRGKKSALRVWLPLAIAVVLVAGVVTGLWFANRPKNPVPTKPPSTAPAVGSCWNVAASTVTSQLPWPSTPVDCAAQHTAEVFYVGQVDPSLVSNGRTAEGQQAQINTLLMASEAREGCLTEVGSYIGGPWRSAQISVYPAFIAPASDGFYACSVAQVADPAGDRLVSRTAGLAGALS